MAKLQKPSTEKTPLSSKSHAVAKLYAYWITVNYREAYGCMRVMVFYLITKVQEGETFVTRKITRGLSRIHLGIEECIY